MGNSQRKKYELRKVGKRVICVDTASGDEADMGRCVDFVVGDDGVRVRLDKRKCSIAPGLGLKEAAEKATVWAYEDLGDEAEA